MNRILQTFGCLLALVSSALCTHAVSVASFSPTYGSAGSPTLITIKGTGFYPGEIQVKFNETISLYAQATTADGTTIQARVPAGASTGPITVSVYNPLTGIVSASSADNFTVIGPEPYVAFFTPSSGGGGTKVTLTGANFTQVTNVTFNGKKGTSLAIAMDTSLSVYTPAGVTTGPIVVKSPLGTFTTSSNFWVPPVLTTMSPTSGRSGTNITLKGTNFTGTTAVLFAGPSGTFTIPAAFTVISNLTLAIVAPTNAATGKVRVVTPAGSATTTNNFKVLPVIYSQSPAYGPAGTVVTLTGANFNVGTPTIRFNGKTAAATSALSFNSVKATAPSGVTTGPISVTTTDGSYTNTQFFYVPASITSISSSNSPPGTTITITGQNFLGATAVLFNGMPAAAFTVTNNTSMGVVIPPAVPTGPVTVVTPAGSVSTSGLFYGAPVVTGFSPAHGLPGTNVTIYGTNFLGTTLVSFNGKTASFSATNNGIITAAVPAGATTGLVTIGGPGGTNSSAGPFVIDSTDLAISMTAAPNPAFLGSNLVYTLHVANNGPLSAPSVVVSNRLPANVSLISAHVSQGAVNTAGSPLYATLGQVDAGAEAVVTLTVKPGSTGSLTNTAWVSSSFADPVVANNTNVIVVSAIPVPLLSIASTSNLFRIAWSSALSNYTLQYSEHLNTNTSWTNILRSPTRSNDILYILETNDRPGRYYRLKNP